MRKRIWVSLLAAAALALIAVAVVVKAPVKPEYQGRKLSAWLADLKTPSKAAEAQRAVRAIGPAAVPTLSSMLRVRDTDLTRRILAWGGRHWSRLRTRSDLVPARELHDQAIQACIILGPAAAGTVPAFLDYFSQGNVGYWNDPHEALLRMGDGAMPPMTAALNHPNEWVRFAMGHTFARSPKLPDGAIPALLKNLSDSSPRVRYSAIIAFARYPGRDRSATVLPHLLPVLDGTNSHLRSAAVETIATFAAEAQSSAPLLLRLVSDPSEEVSAEAAIAVAQIDPALASAAPAVPAQLQLNLTNALWHVRKRSADMLATLGTNGNSALPALTNLLADKETFVRESAGKAIRVLARNVPTTAATTPPP